MKLTFLGTRGGIIPRSDGHFFHSSLLISFYHTKLLIDWGSDWKGTPLPPVDALLITHAHEDHCGGLPDDLPTPVYATEATERLLKKPCIQLTYEQPYGIGSLIVEAFEVHHSVHASAVGYRITGGKRTIFYVPDVLEILHMKKALTGIDLYVGDGAIVSRTLLKRMKDGIPTGHSPIVEQLTWCADTGVPRAVFTHCGSEIVKADPAEMRHTIKELGKHMDVKASLAIDGLTLEI